MLFAALLLWGWRTTDLVRTVPAYGDALEGLWATTWYAEALSTGSNPAVYPLAFFPGGWHLATYAWGPANFAILLPLYSMGGAAFAYNVSTLVTFGLAFAGTLALAQRFVSRPAAAVVAALYTFWGVRWYNIIGQLNIALGSALLPWLAWSLDRGLESSRRSWAWYVLTGVIWAVSISASLYFIWIGGVLLLAWLVGCWKSVRRDRRALMSMALIPVVAGLFSLPATIPFWRAIQTIGAHAFSIYVVNQLGANANSLPLPSTDHPWLHSAIDRIYKGNSGEVFIGLGLLVCLTALLGLATAVKSRKTWGPVLVLASIGLILALGLTLRWNDVSVRWELMRPVNRAIWYLGYLVKPELFLASQPPAPFDAAVPMPGLLLAAVVPFFEQARVFARYALLAGLAIFLLAGLGLDRLRNPWVRVTLGAVLVLEVLPAPTQSYAFPPPSHPAFQWLQQQSPGSEGIVEFATQGGDRLALRMGGSTIWATRYHGQPTVSGASSIMPAQLAFLEDWLSEHFHPFQDPEFLTLLSYYRARYILLHMYGGSEQRSFDEAVTNAGLRLVECFASSTLAQPYDHPICVFEILPSGASEFNVLFREGWSGPESWGRWIDGTEARALWVASKPAVYQLAIEAFPYCAPDRNQHLTVEVNGVAVATHQWIDCEPWSGMASIPSELIRPGANELVIRTAFGTRPVDATDGENPDSRSLSAGVTQLRVGALP